MIAKVIRGLKATFLLPNHARLVTLRGQDGRENICLGEGNSDLPRPGRRGAKQVHPGGEQVLLQ
jgi:hypothetical protein